MKNVLKLTVFSAFLVIGVALIAPKPAHALFLDFLFEDAPYGPHCIMMDCNKDSGVVNNVINSNNTNSFNNTVTVGTNNGTVNAPYAVSGATGATVSSDAYLPPAHVSAVAVATTPYQAATPSTNTNTNYNYNYNSGGGSTYVPTPVYYNTPSYYSTPAPIYYHQSTYHTQPYQYPVYGTYQTYQQPAYHYQQPVYNYSQPISYAQGIQVACAADRTTATLGQPVTWSAEATYNNSSVGMRYSWTGTEGLSGNSSDAIMAYYSTGPKSAVVTAFAPNGQMQSKVCGNSVTVKSATIAKAPVVKATPKPVVVVETPTPTPTPEAVVSAASLLSLGNVPWGWVGILIILILAGIIFYLIFNKKKI